MIEPRVTADVEAEDVTDELSDEAIDRVESRSCVGACWIDAR